MRPICGVFTDQPIFHLSFDDGPHPEVTPRVLDVLDEFDAPATFFVLTDAARRYPDVLQDVMDRGHELGLHGRSHRPLPGASWRLVDDEVVGAHRRLEGQAGREVRLFRPPYGLHGTGSRLACRLLNLTTVLWSVDTYDWTGLSGANPLGEILPAVGRGGIALLHDTPVGASVADEAAQGRVGKERLTRALLEHVRATGLTPVSLADLVAAGPPNLCRTPPGGRRSPQATGRRAGTLASDE